MRAFVLGPWSYEMEKVPQGDQWESDSFDDSWDSFPSSFDEEISTLLDDNDTIPNGQ